MHFRKPDNLHDFQPDWETNPSFSHARALYHAGYAHESGMGRRKDLTLAAKLYRKSALLGYPPAQNSIGFLHATGRGVALNELLAIEWFRKAAEQGHSPAEMNLGVMYSEGRGIEADETFAMCCFYRAAMSGNSEAQEFLAHALQDGLCGLEQDRQSAAFWLEQSLFERSSG